MQGSKSRLTGPSTNDRKHAPLSNLTPADVRFQYDFNSSRAMETSGCRLQEVMVSASGSATMAIMSLRSQRA